ncbi:MAG: hypothetical protein JJT75_14690 [Opitutales bacterium]|nr:hypothetical protein [Opitutales bacterium]
MPVSILTIELTEFVLRVGKAEAKGRGFHFESLEEVLLSDGERIEEVLSSLAEAGAEEVAASVQPTNKAVQFITLDQLSGMNSEADLRAFLQEQSGIKEEAIMAAVDAERGKPYSFDGVKELNALTALFPKKNIRNAKAFLEGVGLTPKVLQPATLLHVGSLLQYLNYQKENEPVLMLEVGEGSSHVAFASLYGVTNMIPISTGLGDMLAATQEELSLDSVETAHQLFSTGGDDLLEIEQTVLKKFLDALNPLFELFETQTGVMPSYLVTTGLPEKYSWLEKALCRETNIKPLEFDFSGWLKSLEITGEGPYEDLLHSRSSLALFHLLRAHRAGKPEFMWQLDFNRYLGTDSSPHVPSSESSSEFEEQEPTEVQEPAEEKVRKTSEEVKGGLKLKPGGGQKEEKPPPSSPSESPKKTSSPGLSLRAKESAKKESKKPSLPSDVKGKTSAKPPPAIKKPEEQRKEEKDSPPEQPKKEVKRTAEDASKKDEGQGKDTPESGANDQPETSAPEVAKGKPRPDPSERKETFAPPPQISGKKKDASSEETETEGGDEESGEKSGKGGLLVKMFVGLLILGVLGGGYYWWQSDRHLAGLSALSASPSWNAISPDNANRPGLAWIRPDDESILLTAYPLGLSGDVLDRAFLSYREWEGNFSILGDLGELTEGAQGGLLLVEGGTRGNARVILYREGNEVILRARSEAGEVEELGRVEAQGQNLWLRMDRSGSGIAGFVSFNGETWERVGRTSVGTETVQAGWALVPSRGEPESLFRVSRVRAGAF